MMNTRLTSTVRDVMSKAPYLVSATQKLGEVARLFSKHHISSAPVIDEAGRCIGIITSSDLVRYQSQIDSVYSRIDYGMAFEVAHNTSDGQLELVPHPFDEVQRQMTPVVQTISPGSSLTDAARIMTEQRIHHIVVLDESERVIGILSSLDLLSKLNEDPQ